MAMDYATGGLALLQLGLGFVQSENQRAYGSYQERIANFNAQMADRQAERVIEKARTDSNRVRAQGEQIVGKQKVGFAGQGVDINVGSAAEIQDETRAFAAADAQTVENNAYLEAMGIKYQAADTRNQGRMAKISANASADASLVNAGLKGALTMSDYGSKKK